jgi:alpha-amylase
MGDYTVSLPDLDTENTDVQSGIKDWIEKTVLTLRWLTQVKTYNLDGLRVDAVKSIPYSFAQMVNNVTDSYAIGEVFDGDAGYCCLYQANGLDGFLNFPVYFQVTYTPR